MDAVFYFTYKTKRSKTILVIQVFKVRKFFIFTLIFSFATNARSSPSFKKQNKKQK